MHPQQLKQNIRLLYKRPPVIIDPRRIEKMYDLSYIRQLECIYDDFINNHQHSLTLYNLIEYILDIRDAIIIRRYQLERYYCKSL